MADGVDYPEADPKPKRKRKKKKRNPENKKLKCPDCDRKFYFNCQLNFHRLVHTGEKPYTCDICDKAFNTPYSLKNHKYIHTDEKPFRCSYCKYACRDNSTLRKHEARHTGMETIYGCKLCDKSYKTKHTLKVHVSEAHMQVDLRSVPCAQCGKLFKSKSQMNTHVKLTHNRSNAGHCPICKVYIPRMYNLDSHLSTHVDARPYRCSAPHCTSAFKDKGSLRKHMRIHNLDDQYPCDICGRLFARRHRLNNHVLTVHAKRRTVQCDHCGVKFYSKAYLINHIKKKHGPRRRRYECDICGLLTHNKPSIVMHLKHAHRNEEDLRCKICHTVYKKHIYLKHHYKFTHKIAYKTKTRSPLTIKEEPCDDASSVHSLDLFEVDKTEPGEESNPLPDESQPLQLETVVECERLSLSREAFDQLYVQQTTRPATGHTNKPTKPTETNPKVHIDKKALEYVKKTKVKLIAEARRREAALALERARQEYNERMRRLVQKTTAEEGNKKPIKVKFFQKQKTKCLKVEKKTTDKPLLNNEDIINGDHENNENISKVTVDDGEPSKANVDGEDDSNVNGNVDDKPEEESNVDDETKNADEGDVTDDEKGDKSSDEEWNCKKQKTGKINFNSHQCYICFKLYETKEKLLDHCKDHFDVCNEKFLKKCPLCPHVTKNSISRHMRLTHGVRLKLPYSRIQDRLHNDEGSRYYLQIDDPLVHKMEVIPSVKNLNKIASMKIDKKHREEKSKTLAKTKLVKKGKEWIVETEKIDIGDDVIMPEFDSDTVKNLDKIGDSDGYFDGLKKLYHIAKKNGKSMLFPCQSCDKICRNLAALKLHNRKHEVNPKPFKKKVWKHKLKDGKANKKPAKTIAKTNNRFVKPKPIKNKHKCDPELKTFYENNIRGGNIEFWQFLKIFNKMGRDNITDFKDLESRREYGIIVNEEKCNNEDDESKDANEIEDNANLINEGASSSNLSPNKPKKPANNENNKIVTGISKINNKQRNLAKQRLREKYIKNNHTRTSVSLKERSLAKQRLRDDIFMRSQIVMSNAKCRSGETNVKSNTASI